MGKADWFGLLLTALSLGTGAVMSTLGKRVVRVFGVALMVVGAGGFFYWLGYYHSGAEHPGAPTIIGNAPSSKSRPNSPFRTLPANPADSKKLAPVILNEGTNARIDNVTAVGAGTVLENKGKGLHIKNSQLLQGTPHSAR